MAKEMGGERVFRMSGTIIEVVPNNPDIFAFERRCKWGNDAETFAKTKA